MRALVTGGAVRLGRAIANALGDAGWDVAFSYRSSADAARTLVADLDAAGVRGLSLQADLATVEGVHAVADGVTRAWGGVDLVVHNAAAWERVPFDHLDASRWDAMLALNLRAPALLTRALLPGLRASTLDGGGLVVNVGDIAADRPVPGYAHYCASKAGLHLLTRALAVELAPEVRVNAIAPGTVIVPETLDHESLEAIRATIPAGAFGTGADVAAVVLFLATAAPYVTGQVWAVDGGRSAVGPMAVG